MTEASTPDKKPTPHEQKAVTPAPPSRPTPLEQRAAAKPGVGAAIGNGLAAATGTLVEITSKIFGEVQERAGNFRARPEHSRWRAYALGSYGIVLAATMIAQLWTDNTLNAYVRVQPVELPALTQIFVRNDSRKPWLNVKLTLNGIYSFEQAALNPGLFILLPVNRFAVFDATGKPTYAPKNIQPKTLSIDTVDQHYETELRP